MTFGIYVRSLWAIAHCPLILALWLSSFLFCCAASFPSLFACHSCLDLEKSGSKSRLLSREATKQATHISVLDTSLNPALHTVVNTSVVLLRKIMSSCTGSRTLALDFDVGSYIRTSQIQNTSKSNRSNATFFPTVCMGHFSSDNATLLKMMLDLDYQILPNVSRNAYLFY